MHAIICTFAGIFEVRLFIENYDGSVEKCSRSSKSSPEVNDHGVCFRVFYAVRFEFAWKRGNID